MTKTFVDGERCECDWIGNEKSVQPCPGCDEAVRLYRDIVVHGNGKHWHQACWLNDRIKNLDAKLFGLALEAGNKITELEAKLKAKDEAIDDFLKCFPCKGAAENGIGYCESCICYMTLIKKDTPSPSSSDAIDEFCKVMNSPCGDPTCPVCSRPHTDLEGKLKSRTEGYDRRGKTIDRLNTELKKKENELAEIKKHGFIPRGEPAPFVLIDEESPTLSDPLESDEAKEMLEEGCKSDYEPRHFRSVKCSHCGYSFDHVYTHGDLMRCPKCDKDFYSPVMEPSTSDDKTVNK